MKTIKVTDAAARFIKQLREEVLANDEYSEADLYPLMVIHDYHKLIEELSIDDEGRV